MPFVWQDQTIFFLVRTNGEWEGIGYAVSNNSMGCAGAGTLYRYEVTTNAPLEDNSLYGGFVTNLGRLNNVLPGVPLNFHRVADGVIHLKLYAFDQAGNENSEELFYGDDYQSGFAYPLPSTNVALADTNDLPASLMLEVGVLEPDTYDQARAMSANATVESNFLRNAAANVHLFRTMVPVAGAVR